MGKHIDPDRIIQTSKKYFKDELSKPKLWNMTLTLIAIAMAEKLKINEISKKLPIKVKNKKSKQKRLGRFLDVSLPMWELMTTWSRFVLRMVKNEHKVIVIIDETKLINGYKAIVAAIPFRKRAIPLMFVIYSNQQIRDMVYLSQNEVEWNFISNVHKALKEILPDKEILYVLDRGYADIKLMESMDENGMKFVIRVPKNSGIESDGYIGKLESFGKEGYFKDILYHLQAKKKLNLFCAYDPQGDDPLFLISNADDGLRLIYKKRMQIEESFRDLKWLFGFNDIELKKDDIERVGRILLLVIMSMSMLFILYEKSGYRWSKEYNTKSSKEYSLIHVIKDKIRDSWNSLKLSTHFPLSGDGLQGVT